MHIKFERTGGFAGMRLAFTTDSDTLPDNEAEVLHDEVSEACFFDLPASIHDPEAGSDRFQYLIKIRDGSREHSIEVGEASVEDSLRPLIQHLEILARTPHI